MPLIKAFRGLRPRSDYVKEVVAPPYDVINFEEAKALAADKPWSFLHISRPEIDLPAGTDPYDDVVYQQGKKNLERMMAEGVLQQDDQPSYYVYRLTMGNHQQTGLVAVASVSAYDQGRIKKHEFTRPIKENDRVKNIDTLNAQTGPVFLVYPAQDTIDRILQAATQGEADMVAELNGVQHEIWLLQEPSTIATLTQAFESLPALYVADGHHRSAAASRVAARRRTDQDTGEESHHYFLSVIFPHDQMQILDYNRIIKDLNGLSPEQFLQRLESAFTVQAAEQPVKPQQSGEYGLYLDGRWYRLRIRPEKIPADDPVARLDVSLLQNHLIAPILGIEDPRTDERIDFVGGIRGLAELEKRVNSGDWRLAFSLYPTSMEALMAVADAGEVMPPKSTWFEPKLADGLVSHLLD